MTLTPSTMKVDTNNLAGRCSLQSKGVVVAKILFGSEWQLVNILNSLYIVRPDVQFLHLVTIERHMVVDILHNLMETLTLERASLVAAHAFFI